MQDMTYVASDGLRVTLTARTWREHIQVRHPEVRLGDIERALTDAIRIYDHRQYGAQQIYEGPPGTTRQGRRTFPVVVVERLSATAGIVVTARVARRPYPGVQRWP
jgi:hypothetical protein